MPLNDLQINRQARRKDAKRWRFAYRHGDKQKVLALGVYWGSFETIPATAWAQQKTSAIEWPALSLLRRTPRSRPDSRRFDRCFMTPD